MNNFKILFIKKIDNNYIVFSKNKQYNGEYYAPIKYNDFDCAINLCRLRLNKTLFSNNIKIFKIPFINFWMVF